MSCMNETLTPPHIVTVGRHRIARVLERVAEGFDSQARLTHLSTSFDNAVDAVLSLHARTPIDALVLAGASGAWIRERVDIPVAMVEVRGFDLLGALARARALSPRVALVTFGAPSEHVAQFDAQFGAGIAQFSYQGPQDAAACVQALQAAGIGAVVAPGLVADLAEEAGIASVLLYSDAAVQQAFNEALRGCRNRQTSHHAARYLGSNQRQRKQGGGGVRWRIDDFLGDSPAAQRLRTLALQCAASDATVLICGESGTGKELIAQGIHRASRRAQQPFLAVNCAALGESLLESELFGYEEGAFTGARRGGKTGLVEAAHTGTLFLDEIGDMPLALQSRLLRVLQEREVLRVGATTPVPVDVRVIAATHADLVAQVDKGLFRRDLYYRLAVLRLTTPALRERTASDIAQLAQALLAQRLKTTGSATPASLPALLTAVLQPAAHHRWPGNVRELENWVERLLACHASLCDAQGALDAARLQELFPECAAPPPASALKDTRHQAEQQHLREVLASVNGDQRQACAILGISRATLWRRMKR
ncbi:MAG: propionate catabolism operon regulatory protein PrpR [Giesbergeria sp.]|nr:propionate catabolism operon regulatory protein PrpR [Giesbergeria sp.]